MADSESRDPVSTAPFDAFLLVSFGGPEKAEDVVPFLRNVTAGKDIPDERLEEVGEHYYGFGGRSPINDQNRDLIAAIEADFAEHGIDLPVYWGNRNWDPYLTDALEQMRAEGVTRAVSLLTSAYSSYSGCRQYRENLFDARAEVEDAPALDRLRAYYDHPGFVAANVDRVRDAADQLGEDARLVFVTHSIPDAMNDVSGPDGGAYVAQHHETARLITEALGRDDYDLVYCSRSGPPHVPWLEPDVNDHLEELATDGVSGVVLVPIGFVSDHMEVIYDLDTEALETAERVGIRAVRAGTAGTHPEFVRTIRELVLERAAAERGESPERPQLGERPVCADRCPVGCCRNLRQPDRPAHGGADTPADVRAS